MPIETINDSAIVFQVRGRINRMCSYLKSYYGKPVHQLLEYKPKEFRMLLNAPTPDFYHAVYNLYYFTQIGEDDDHLNSFKRWYNHEMFVTNCTKESKV